MTANTKSYRLRPGAKHWLPGKYKDTPAKLAPEGHILHLTEAQAHALRDRVDSVSGSVPEPQPEPTPSAAPDEVVNEGVDVAESDLPDLKSMKAGVAKEHIAGLSNVDVLVALLEVENRKSVSKAIEDRIIELGEE